MRRLSKEVRWTIYTLITLVIMGFGYWLTLNESPDRYTPRQTPDAVIYGDVEDRPSSHGGEPHRRDE